ncbi:MAG TPA: hypothetical protein VGB73_01985 [Pyrinomonadaceae bacterium]|jgi:hypothetical protein
MFQTGKRLTTLSLSLPALACAALLFGLTLAASAQERRALNSNSAAPAAAAADDEPPFKEYKGVSLGMSADEVRKKLGTPQDKSSQQDFYSFSDKEGAQVFYDAQQKVSAIAITYMGDVSSAPTPQAVFGSPVQAQPDGTVYKREKYQKAGLWLSYSRTGGDMPMVAVTIQKAQ